MAQLSYKSRKNCIGEHVEFHKTAEKCTKVENVHANQNERAKQLFL